ncbi:MAG: hypothetical protein IKO72_00785 [Kiritimatiellae bacterium]|nr:hypothetical protein [Kiritimatiellia bacterium]
MQTNKTVVGAISLRYMFALAFAISVHSVAIGGYGDLPDTFDASTGYVTLNTSDTAGNDGHSSFFDGTNWSDTRPPHSDTNYYVASGKMFGTPRQAAYTEAQLAVDPTALTFKGNILVCAGEVRGQSYTYEFEIPDLRMLPGANFYWASPWPQVLGKVTTYGTSSTPVRFDYYLSGDEYLQNFGMDMKSDSSSYLIVRAPRAGDRASKLAYTGYIVMTGDLSEYYGTLKASAQLLSDATNHYANYGFGLAASASNATVVLEKKGGILAMAPGGAEVRRLSIDGAETLIRMKSENLSHDAPRLTVGEELALNGHSVRLELSDFVHKGSSRYEFPHANPNPAEDVALIRLKPATVTNGGFGEVNEMFAWADPMAAAKSEWRPDPDGGMTLWRLSYVTNNVGDSETRSCMTNALTTGGKNQWSDGMNPADPDAASKRYFTSFTIHVPKATSTTPFSFGGGSLTMYKSSLNTYSAGYGFYCSELVLRGANFMLCNANIQSPTRLNEDDGGKYNFYRFQGKIRVPAGYSNTCYVWGTRQVMRVEAEVEGGGRLVCTPYKSSNYINDSAYYEFTALNTNFTGKISMSMAYDSTKYASQGIVVPNWTQRPRLFVSDERNLGGRCEEFVWDSLLLEHYSDLFPLNDVTFTDGWNRGIAIGDIGRMKVQSGLTLTILRPLNVNGHFVKEGDGTLALGGRLAFNGAAQSATPTAGNNLFTIMGGSIKPLSTNAFDGLAITFTNNASIKLDATTAADGLLDYGIVDLKETTSPITLAANKASIPVTVAPPAIATPHFAVAICTIGSGPAAGLQESVFSVAHAAPYRFRRVEKRSNADGSVTYLAHFCRKGLVVSIK